MIKIIRLHRTLSSYSRNVKNQNKIYFHKDQFTINIYQ